MPQIEVDLNARIVPANHSVFIMRPGQGYKLFAEVKASELVFPDLPALSLDQHRTLDSYEDLSQRLALARSVRAWHRGGRRSDPPRRELSSYESRLGDPSLRQLESVVRGYFDRAKRGDLVLVPPKSYSHEALIGELLDDPQDFVYHNLSAYPEERVPARRVRWRARVQKRKLPQRILDALEKPSAIFLLEKSLRAEIYEYAYGNYIEEGRTFSARFDTESEVFTVEDEFLLQAFFKFVAANTKAADEGREKDISGIVEASFKDAGAYVPELQININSPGTISLLCEKLTPLVAAVLLVLAIEVPPADAIAAQQNGTLILKNSAAVPNDTCTAQVHEAVMTQLKFLGLHKWPEACEKAAEVARRTGVKSPARVRK